MAALTDNHELPPDLLGAFCRHIISLSWVDAKTQPDGASDYDPKAFAVSGFVISVRNIWFLVTAGHILRDLDNRLRAGRRIVNSRLIDGFVSREPSQPIPFPLGDTPQWYVYDDGLDYALIPLRTCFVRLLSTGGVSALGENAWVDIPESPDGDFLLGFPNQAAEIAVAPNGGKGNVTVSLGTPLLPVQRVYDPPDVLKRGAERFYASVPFTDGDVGDKQITLTDIDGMSGGPIFAVQRAENDRFRYWVVAVQSGWAKRSRVLAACPIRPLIDAIAKCIDAHDDDLAGHEIETDSPRYGA